MALDFYYLSNDGENNPSFRIKNSELEYFENAFNALQEKTGVFVDPYGKSKIYPDHLKIIINNLKAPKEKVVVDFVKFLTVAIQSDNVIVADGD